MTLIEGIESPGDHSILVVEDDASYRESLVEMLRHGGFEVKPAESAEEALKLVREWVPDLVITDHRLPNMSGVELVEQVLSVSPVTEVVVVTAYSSIALAISAVKKGAFDFIEKPFTYEKLQLVVQRAFEHQRLVLDRDRLTERLQQHQALSGFVGRSPALEQVQELIRAVASSETTVLIVGESGTGKELVATAIHDRSRRSGSAFLRVNCAALPEGLLESTMFGHERGAFTGAHARSIGIFERAKGGTLLLDEVTEMAPNLQAKLLRVLELGEFERVGGQRTLQSDVRVIAATNRDPQRAVAEKRLREDLLYRLKVVSITIPPLRERVEDVPVLAGHFVRLFAERHQRDAKVIAPAAMRTLLAYRWPGNVRELENAIEHAVIFGAGPTVAREDLPVEILDAATNSRPTESESPRLPVPMSLREIEYLAAVQTLEHTRGNKAEAARILGISRDTLYQKLRRSGA